MKIVAKFWKWWYRWHPTQSRFTRPEALAIAKEHGLEWEVIEAMKQGCSPDEALQEWDIYPYNT